MESFIFVFWIKEYFVDLQYILARELEIDESSSFHDLPAHLKTLQIKHLHFI